MAASERPNVLLILCDDMGYSDIGCFGSEIRTPNIDALAAGGVRFTQAYNCARCCPSRAALLTGVYPHQAGIGYMVQDMGVRQYQGYLRDDCATVAEALAPAGYLTGLSGKWHAGGFFVRTPEARHTWNLRDPVRPLPTAHGFERFFGNPAGGGSYFNPQPLVDQDRIIEPWDGFYSTDAYTDAALRMIDEAHTGGRPFFVHLCYNAPHWPLHALPEDIGRYRGTYRRGWDAIRTARHERMKGLGVVDRRWPISPRDEQAPPWESVGHQDWEDARMATYAAMVDRMDQNIGRLVARLRELGILDNTLIFFLSDNGGSAEFLRENARSEAEWPVTRDGRPVRTGNIPGQAPGGPDTFMSYDLPWANVSNTPLRRFKSWVHEGGISTPLIAHWPGAVAGGAINHQPLHIIDIVATIVDVCGSTYPRERRGVAIQELEGESFSAALRGLAWQRQRPIFFEHMGNRAVRHRQWKLVNRHPHRWELYDIDADRTELNDLADREPARVAALTVQYEQWAQRIGVLPWEQVKELAQARRRSG